MAAIAPPNELILTESRTMRMQTIEHTDVLDKIKTLVTLPDSFHVTTEMVATYYEVPVSTIDSLVSANFEELTGNGRRVLQGSELTAFATPFGGVANLGLSPKARSLAVFSRKAVLNVGQLLTRSEVARQVRTYLLNAEAEQTQTPRIPSTFAEALELAAAQARELEQAQAALEVAAPKAEAHDRLIADGGDRILRIIAGELQVKEHWLRQQLLDWGWIYTRWADCGALQYVPYADKRECFSLKEKEIPHHNREGCWHVTLQVTPKGREAIRRKLAKQEVRPATPPRTLAPVPTEAEIFQMVRRGA